MAKNLFQSEKKESCYRGVSWQQFETLLDQLGSSSHGRDHPMIAANPVGCIPPEEHQRQLPPN
jgi:ribosome biogenesis protein Tsr3